MGYFSASVHGVRKKKLMILGTDCCIGVDNMEDKIKFECWCRDCYFFGVKGPGVCDKCTANRPSNYVRKD